MEADLCNNGHGLSIAGVEGSYNYFHLLKYCTRGLGTDRG